MSDPKSLSNPRNHTAQTIPKQTANNPRRTTVYFSTTTLSTRRDQAHRPE
jgi:hypothetical protein